MAVLRSVLVFVSSWSGRRFLKLRMSL
jgi:hypothetical protein